MTKLSEYFDISVSEQLEVMFQSVTSDKNFIFSGPPEFKLISETNRALCPLIFMQGLQIAENRQPGPRVASVGTMGTIDMPSSQGNNQINLSGYAVIGGTPHNILAGATNVVPTDVVNERWNLLKRVYYDAITFQEGALLNYFLPKDGEKSNLSEAGFNVVGADKNDLFTNFSKSEFYEIPFGILIITKNKSNSFVTSRYYEGCKLMSPGAFLAVTAGTPAAIQPQLAITYKNEIPLSAKAVNGWFDNPAENSFMATLKSYLGTT